MGRGHIRLGFAGQEMKDYVLKNPIMHNYRKYLANPQAEKLNIGERRYQDQNNWDYFVMSDWQAGVGQKDPEAGGFLYSNSDTRFPEQVILCPWAEPTSLIDSTNLSSSTRHPFYTLIAGNTLAIPTAAPTGLEVEVIWVFLDSDKESLITLSLYTSVGNEPNTLIDVATSGFSDSTPGGQWVRFDFQSVVVVPSSFFMVIEGDTDIEFCIGDGDGACLLGSGGTWSSVFSGNRQPLHVIRENGIPITQETGVRKIISFNDTVYLFCDDFYSKWNEDNNVWGAPVTIGSTKYVTDAIVFDGKIWIAFGDSADMRTLNASDTLATVTGIKATNLLVYNGYLWRSFSGNEVKYTANGSTWSPDFVMNIGPPDYKVTALVGLEQDIIVTTEEGLYRIAPGDWVFGIAPWGSIRQSNGQNSLNWNGAVTIPTGQDLLRYSQDGSIMSIGLNRREGLPEGKQGRITTQLNFNNWLVAGVSPTASLDFTIIIGTEDANFIACEDEVVLGIPGAFPSGGHASLWAWNVEGWHSLGILLPNMYVESLLYQRDSETMWIVLRDSQYVIPCKLRLPNDLTNPAKDNRELWFSPYGWLETDWYDGRLLEIPKDYESLYVATEFVSDNQPIELYWMDSEGVNAHKWVKLGECNAQDTLEIRWDDYAFRPNSRRLKFGVLLKSNNSARTPILNAFRAKFVAVVGDRYGWNLRIMVSINPEGVDGKLISETPSQLQEALEGFERSVPPFILQDLDGRSYEVRMISSYQEVEHYEYLPGDEVRLDIVHNWNIEQVWEGQYTP